MEEMAQKEDKTDTESDFNFFSSSSSYIFVKFIIQK